MSKKILFVDDKSVTHTHFRDALKRESDYQDCIIELAFDLRDAVEILKQQPDFDVVIIDLHLPDDIPDELSQFYRKRQSEIRLNEGQLLGEHLRCLYPTIRYFYLSAYSGKYREDWEGSTAPTCLDKDVTADKFIEVFKKTQTFKANQE